MSAMIFLSLIWHLSVWAMLFLSLIHHLWCLNPRCSLAQGRSPGALAGGAAGTVPKLRSGAPP